MIFDFEFILTLVVIVSGLIYFIDELFFVRARAKTGTEHVPVIVDYARSFFPVLLVVLLLRTFVVEPYRIPSGSDEPTLLVGDFIVANKFAYGLRLPVLHDKIFAIGEPKTGDIILFRWPIDPSRSLIKRVIGMPGDRIDYVNKVLFVNGQQAMQQFVANGTDVEVGQTFAVSQMQEILQGIKHDIFLRSDIPAQNFSVVVPAGKYFVMGDNRDNSNDSRYWGFVPETSLVGKAYAVIFSWDSPNHSVRWDRVGTRIH